MINAKAPVAAMTLLVISSCGPPEPGYLKYVDYEDEVMKKVIRPCYQVVAKARPQIVMGSESFPTGAALAYIEEATGYSEFEIRTANTIFNSEDQRPDRQIRNGVYELRRKECINAMLGGLDALEDSDKVS